VTLKKTSAVSVKPTVWYHQAMVIPREVFRWLTKDPVETTRRRLGRNEVWR